MASVDHLEAVRQQYQNTDAWRIRLDIHEKYTRPKVDLVGWTMKHLSLQGSETLLDVGCGPGLYYNYIQENLPGIRYYGVDTSFGMMEGHPLQHRLARGSMDDLPFPDDMFDVVMANHVIHLAPDIDAALTEMRRVLKPGGIFAATTNSLQTMPQFRELFRRAILLVSPPGVNRDVKVPQPMHNRFALENGSRMLAHHYYAVVRHDLPGAFIFPAVDPIMDYLESTRSVHEPQLPENVTWEQVMMIMREQVTNLIASLQTLVVDKLTGVLIATDSGGFINEFLAHRNGSPPTEDA